jgi:hypothetical protein
MLLAKKEPFVKEESPQSCKADKIIIFYHPTNITTLYFLDKLKIFG